MNKLKSEIADLQDHGVKRRPIDLRMRFFRFRKSNMHLLTELWGAARMQSSIPVSKGQYAATALNEGLCILLRIFAYPSRYSDLIQGSGRSVPELSMISNLVMDTITD